MKVFLQAYVDLNKVLQQVSEVDVRLPGGLGQI